MSQLENWSPNSPVLNSVDYSVCVRGGALQQTAYRHKISHTGQLEWARLKAARRAGPSATADWRLRFTCDAWWSSVVLASDLAGRRWRDWHVDPPSAVDRNQFIMSPRSVDGSTRPAGLPATPLAPNSTDRLQLTLLSAPTIIYCT